MTDAELNKKIDERIQQTLMAPNNFIVPRHLHNGSDAPQIPADYLIPYTIVDSTFDDVLDSLGTQRITEGQQMYFNYSIGQPPPGNYYNWGTTLFLGNNGTQTDWSFLNLADFYVDANQLGISQDIDTGDTATIIFDNDFGVSKPAGAYDTSTGIFSVIQNSDGEDMIYSGWNTPLLYLVTAQVAVAPNDVGTYTDEKVFMNLVVDGVEIASTFNHFVNDTEPIVLSLNIVTSTPITEDVKITVDNPTAPEITTQIAGGNLFTFFKIKQLK